MSEKKYKVMRVSIHNFKNIPDLELDLNGRSVFIIGENSEGKSSTIQAIWTSLSNKRVPEKPITTGEDKAEVMVVIGIDGKEYSIKKVYTVSGERLEITSPDGFKTSKISALENLIGDINFDIMKFVDLSEDAKGRREQVKEVRKFISPEANNTIDQMDERVKMIEENRTDLNKEIKNLSEKVKGVEFSEQDYEDFKEPVDASELMKELKEIQTFNSGIEKDNQMVIDSQKLIDDAIKDEDDMDKEIVELSKKLEQKKTSRKAMESKLTEFKELIAGKEPKPTDELEKKISESSTHNEKYSKVKAHLEMVAELDGKKTRYSEMTAQRDAVLDEKTKLLSLQKLPIDGLTFDENGLYINGIPLSTEQQSTSELIEIGFKLAISRSPIARIDRAESLGRKRLEAIKKLAAENNIQVFYEEVQRDAEELKFEYIENQ